MNQLLASKNEGLFITYFHDRFYFVIFWNKSLDFVNDTDNCRTISEVRYDHRFKYKICNASYFLETRSGNGIHDFHNLNFGLYIMVLSTTNTTNRKNQQKLILIHNVSFADNHNNIIISDGDSETCWFLVRCRWRQIAIDKNISDAWEFLSVFRTGSSGPYAR